MKNNHGFSNILVVSIILVLLGIGSFLTYNYLQKPNVEKPSNDFVPEIEAILNEENEAEKKIVELEFKGLDNCPKDECKNLELIYNKSQLELLDKDFNKRYLVKIESASELDNLRFNDNYIYFMSKDINLIKTLHSLNIKSGEIKNLFKLDKTFSETYIYTYLIVGNTIYYTGGNACGHVCEDPKESYFKTINSYDTKTGKSEKLNPKNFTDSGYKITGKYPTKFGLESGRLSVWKLEGTKLILSFGQINQAVEYFFEFDLKTKQVTNIDGNRGFYEDLTKKLNEYGILPAFNPTKSPVVLIQNGKIIGQK